MRRLRRLAKPDRFPVIVERSGGRCLEVFAEPDSSGARSVTGFTSTPLTVNGVPVTERQLERGWVLVRLDGTVE